MSKAIENRNGVIFCYLLSLFLYNYKNIYSQGSIVLFLKSIIYSIIDLFSFHIKKYIYLRVCQLDTDCRIVLIGLAKYFGVS